MDQDDCDPNPCQNGGICQDGINSHTCNCASGYDGDNCEIGNIKYYLIGFKHLVNFLLGNVYREIDHTIEID